MKKDSIVLLLFSYLLSSNLLASSPADEDINYQPSSVSHVFSDKNLKSKLHTLSHHDDPAAQDKNSDDKSIGNKSNLEVAGLHKPKKKTISPSKLPSNGQGPILTQIRKATPKKQQEGTSHNLYELCTIRKEYITSQEALKKLGKYPGKMCKGWKNCIEEGSSAPNIYMISATGAHFRSAKQQIIDHYKIKLQLRITSPEKLTESNFFPKGIVIEAQPIHYNYKTGEWKLINSGDCLVGVSDFAPQNEVAGNQLNSTKGYKASGSVGAGVSSSLLTAGPSAQMSGTVSAGYSSSSSSSRTLKDIGITPTIDVPNIVSWKIIFNNLVNSDKGQGFTPAGTQNLELYEWEWQVERQVADANLYSVIKIKNKKGKMLKRKIFLFKINLYAQFALVDPKELNSTKFLPVFNDNNSETQQIIGLRVSKIKDKSQASSKKKQSKKSRQKIMESKVSD